MARIQKRDEKAAGHHTSCINCGELVFDRVLLRCPRCGGRVSYFSDEDLGFLARVAERPVLIASEDERK
jgi:predicted  nucleic acid-binding Zn-ribbon protein